MAVAVATSALIFGTGRGADAALPLSATLTQGPGGHMQVFDKPGNAWRLSIGPEGSPTSGTAVVLSNTEITLTNAPACSGPEKRGSRFGVDPSSAAKAASRLV